MNDNNLLKGRPAGASSEHLDGDVLGSLEKLGTGTMGTMRSIRSNGSVPTLERVKREESNHSIGSHSQTSSGQVRSCLALTMTVFNSLYLTHIHPVSV